LQVHVMIQKVAIHVKCKLWYTIYKENILPYWCMLWLLYSHHLTLVGCSLIFCGTRKTVLFKPMILLFKGEFWFGFTQKAKGYYWKNRRTQSSPLCEFYFCFVFNFLAVIKSLFNWHAY